jgi:hypothetical protein
VVQLQTRNVDADFYNAQCLMGHISSVRPGSELEERAKEREAEGKLDAVMIPEDECWQCEVDQEESVRRFQTMCGLVGCALIDEESCKKSGCRSLD